MHSLAARAALMGMLFVRQLGVGPHVRPVDKPNATIDQLWQAPQDLSRRDLFMGSSALTPVPAVDQPMTFVSQKTSGFSPGYDVRDAKGREWSVKLGPEAQTEVVSSRLLWALGYHQPSTFYVASWELTGGPTPGPQAGARFRPKDSHLKPDGDWSWQHNPFVGTQAYRGLLVLMLMLNSTDLRNENNIVYDVKAAHPERWYAVKDLGATLGRTGVYRPSRNDVVAFEGDPFLRDDSNGHTKFTYHGLQKELLGQLTAADVRWTCDHLPPLLGNRFGRQARDRIQGSGYRTRKARHGNGVAIDCRLLAKRPLQRRSYPYGGAARVRAGRATIAPCRIALDEDHHRRPTDGNGVAVG